MHYKNSSQRFREIVKVMGKYGFGVLINKKSNFKSSSAQNLRKAFEELGPTFIKIGQILSTRPDILPNEYIKELALLQDNVAPEAFNSINDTFTKNFNAPITKLFLEFDEKSFASASIAQVHKAVLKDGRKVIVKIQRPYIYEKMKMDISILYKIIKLTRAKFSDFLIDPKDALDEILSSTELELNFENEKNNILKFHKLNFSEADVYVPYVVGSLCSDKIITMEFITGCKITDKNSLEKSNIDLNKLGEALTNSFLKQVFIDGFFHADPHPGNILIKDNKICFIDFGIMGSLSDSMKLALNEMIKATVYEDKNKLISVLMSIGVKTGYVDRNQLYEDVDYLFASYLSTSFKNIRVSLVFQDIIDVSKRNNIKIPRELVLLAKSAVIFEGVISEISPDINIISVAKPFVLENLKKDSFKNLSFENTFFSLLGLAKNSSHIPSKLLEVLDSLAKGRIKLQLDHKNLNDVIAPLNKMVNRLAVSLIITSIIIGSSFLLQYETKSSILGIPLLAMLGYCLGGVLTIWLLISIFRSGKL